MTSSLLNNLKSFFKFLLGHFIEIFRDLIKSADNIPFNHLTKDALSTLASSGMMLIFNILGVIVFIFLPQGKDVLTIVSEDLSEWHLGSFVWLVFGTIIWSTFSEFGVRYAIYVTDNSGHSLSDARVEWRRKLQKVIADLFLILPFLIILLGMIFNRSMNDNIFSPRENKIGFWLPIIVFYMVMSAVAHIYFRTIKKWEIDDERRKNQNIENKIFDWLHQVVSLTGREKEWSEKLTGIYNDYVFLLPKSDTFIDRPKEDFELFESNFLSASNDEKLRFPQDATKLNSLSIVPKDFRLIKFTEDYKLKKTKGSREILDIVEVHSNGKYRWVYYVPNSFYKKLHSQLYTIVGISLAFFILILLVGVSVSASIGSPGLLAFAFATWIGLYLGILHLDYAIFRRGKPLEPGMPIKGPENNGRGTFKIPRYSSISRFKGGISLRSVLLCMLLFSSCFNDDHPVRNNLSGHFDDREELRTHFTNWVNNYTNDLHHQYYCQSDTSYVFPVVFVCAEGGALRTGAYTSMMLGIIQDSLAKDSIDFKKSVYAYSAVSGGSLGVSFFNTIAHLDGPHGVNYSYRDRSRQFFATDYLSPVIAKMCYSEILQLLLPWHVEKFDRAIALEKQWEYGYRQIGDENYFGDDFLKIYTNLKRDRGSDYPALFINTTEVESGLQCWLSNVRADTNMFYSRERDILRHKIKDGINYSTMINFSSRFPLLSPAACVSQAEGQKLHFVDGGYMENTGAATMNEVLQALAPIIDTFKTKENKFKIRPFVIMLRFGDEPAKSSDISFGNEVSEILYGIYNVRGGRVKMAEKELQKTLDRWKGKIIPLRLSKDGKQVPMNWVLSKRSIDNLDSFVSDTWRHRTSNELSHLYCLDNNYCRNCYKEIYVDSRHSSKGGSGTKGKSLRKN